MWIVRLEGKFHEPGDLREFSIPAQLKIYIENISNNGVTFGYGDQGLYGLCKTTDLVFLTTKECIYIGSHLECGDTYMRALSEFFGIKNYQCINAEGVDIAGNDLKLIMKTAETKTAEIAKNLNT